MRNRLHMIFCVVGCLAVLALPSAAEAGVTGKVSGVVLDSATGEPIVGAIIRVVGTDMGALTDVDGEYFIINLPGGSHDVSVSYMGYEPVTKTGVRVLIDLTTPLDFRMVPAPVELGRQVVVSAANPIVQQDLTATRIIFTADRLEELPNIVSVQSVLRNYPGVVEDREQALHVRGGRAGQVTYFYDGFNIQDPFTATQGIEIIPSALEELSLTSGGYTAEYGEALSGVVSAVSRDGTAQYHGRLKMYEGFTHPYDVDKGDWGGLERIGNRSLAFDLSGPLPGLDPRRYTFFSAGQYLTDPTSLPHNEVTSWTGTGKLTMYPASGWKFKTNVTYYSADGSVYDHRDVNNRSYDFNLDGLPVFEKEAYLVGFSTDYAFNERAVLTGAVNRFHTRTKSAPDHLFDTYWDEWPGYAVDSAGVYNGTIDDENYLNEPDYSDPMQVVGFTVGDDYYPTYRLRETWYDAFSLRFMHQVNKWNQLKTGAEFRQYDINWDFKQFFNDRPYGEKYQSKPTYASFFVQDKMEYDYFIVNLGLRYDFHNADISYNADPYAATPVWKKAETKHGLSPRLGVSFPIAENSKMHFNYGVYYQEPRFQYLYMNYQGDITTGLPLLGNPDLEPERTTSYELGLDHLLDNRWHLNVTAYYKDIEDLVTARQDGLIAGREVTRITNGDYGSVKGIDLALEVLPNGGCFTGSVSYGYMIATGNGSYALEPYYTYITSTTDTVQPFTEYPLDFDQRHTVTGVLSYRVPSDWDGRLLGQKLPGDWGLTLVGYYGSGLPYTKTDQSGNRVGERNAWRLPANYKVDLRFNKDFPLRAGSRLSLFVEVDNLFDRRNVVNLYTSTGLPDNDGVDYMGSLSVSQQALDHYDRLYDNDPQNYAPPRTIRTGLQLNF
ncbi:MAG TPA: TonB-dependent receptor [candidate division Zixibacteria bacterium]|nr:TonB-dependent receptor [candidate division Zixibacteria bacterium]MDD4917004.1 TonB-dependent receptor [candidate division Zixibacteria bacterium]MDM7972605.1 TonB-dependent receptor [candidate division Zixibacteria bacterium]HOD66163.1 TonB-dependent receptor [candidate division Zixibacteria bacterium]HPM36289.1 TonB-dependent receptor [candidate division Zixibacteria bacterium]